MYSQICMVTKKNSEVKKKIFCDVKENWTCGSRNLVIVASMPFITCEAVLMAS